MSTTRRGFLSRLFKGVAVAAVPPSWYLRQGLRVPPDPMPALPNWKPITAASPSDMNARFIACAERIDAWLQDHQRKYPSPWMERTVAYDPKSFQFEVEVRPPGGGA